MARLTRALVSLVVVLLAAGLLAGLLAFLALRGTGSPVLDDLVLGERCIADTGDHRAEVDPEQARNAVLIVGIAQQRGLPGRAATIALATAIQESGLRNIDFGDRDSLGLFQQRPSQGWGTPEQVTDPVYATNAFYDALVRIEGYETRTVTDVAQEVQRSAFPLAYGDHEGEGRALASTLTGYSPASLRCSLRPFEDGSTAAAEPDEDGLTGDARALADDLSAWGPLAAAGIRSASPADPALAGRTLVLDATSSDEAERYAWALGQATLALAATHDVTVVAVDGQVWLRGTDEGGWLTPQESREAADALAGLPEVAPGTVVVTVG